VSGNSNCSFCIAEPSQCPHLSLTTTSFTIHSSDAVAFNKCPMGWSVVAGAQTVGLLYVPEDRAGVIPSAQPDEPIWKDVVAFEVGSQDKDGVEPRIVGTVEFLAISTYTDYSGPNDGKPGWWPGDLVQVEMFDVLWVGREGDIAYRRGLGYIRRDVWERWAPETITTILG